MVVATDGDPDEFNVATLTESNKAALADTEIAAMQPIAITRKEGIPPATRVIEIPRKSEFAPDDVIPEHMAEVLVLAKIEKGMSEIFETVKYDG